MWKCYKKVNYSKSIGGLFFKDMWMHEKNSVCQKKHSQAGTVVFFTHQGSFRGLEGVLIETGQNFLAYSVVQAVPEGGIGLEIFCLI